MKRMPFEIRRKEAFLWLKEYSEKNETGLDAYATEYVQNHFGEDMLSKMSEIEKIRNMPNDEPEDRRRENLKKVMSSNASDIKDLLGRHGIDKSNLLSLPDVGLEEVSRRLEELIEKHNTKIPFDEAERLLLVQNAKLYNLGDWITEYQYAIRDLAPEGFFESHYMEESSKISSALDNLILSVKIDTSNSSEKVEFISRYISLEKRLMKLHKDFISSRNIRGKDFADEEKKIESEIAQLLRSRPQ